MSTTIDKTYDPQQIETKWYQYWEQNHYFAPQGNGQSFSIVLPPPNITGSLHMGHGFQVTLMDILIRYHRMLGDNTLWQVGTDHAGIATQMVVERQINAEGKTRHDLGRGAFVEKIWAWKQTSGGHIARQLRRLGASVDWQHERFTLDESLSHAVRDVFIRLYEEGIIYRGERLVNWDPQLLTAISDLEVINEESEAKLFHIRYPLVDSQQTIIVATTRPETMLGDVAIAVHPDDARYRSLIGQSVQLPLTDRKIPIIADEYVDPNFGSGCVKITPAHDFNDFAVGARHHLQPISILTPTAHLNDNVPAAYRGLERFAARKKILADLEKAGLLVKVEKHVHNVPRGEKSGVIIEPYLTKQWFMKMDALAKPALAVVANGDMQFVPDNWQKTYFQWLENIQDWCISRQLWWGHRIPVWYDSEGKEYVGYDEADVRARYQLKTNVQLTQDEDVLDTWFSSALWPFSALGWPKDNARLRTFFPTHVLVTGFDIIFFWVARMVMLSLKIQQQVPFKHVYITGLIRDSEGQKMSKSKGNVLDPIDLIDGIALDDLIKKRTHGLMQPAMAQKIEKNTRKEFPDGIPSYGTDALRFTFCSLASFTREIRFDTKRLAGYRNFCNKLWNAARYVQMNVQAQPIADAMQPKDVGLIDSWILSSLQKTIAATHDALKQFRFDFFAQVLYDFTWNEFCDWYVELSKPVLLVHDQKSQATTRKTLLTVLETILRLLHPVIPFITEEIWQMLLPLTKCNATSLMLAPYPQVNSAWINEESEHAIAWLKQIVIAIRTVRSEMNISPAKQINVRYLTTNQQTHAAFIKHAELIKTLAKLNSCEAVSNNVSDATKLFVADAELFILHEGLIDPAEQKQLLQKQIAKDEKEQLQLAAKLANPNFMAKAPADVVQKIQARHAELREKLKKQQDALKRL